jgi:hypothetical protein
VLSGGSLTSPCRVGALTASTGGNGLSSKVIVQVHGSTGAQNHICELQTVTGVALRGRRLWVCACVLTAALEPGSTFQSQKEEAGLVWLPRELRLTHGRFHMPGSHRPQMSPNAVRGRRTNYLGGLVACRAPGRSEGGDLQRD